MTGKKNFVGAMVPDITRSVDWVFLHCDLISRRANDVPSDVLYSFQQQGFKSVIRLKKNRDGSSGIL